MTMMLTLDTVEIIIGVCMGADPADKYAGKNSSCELCIVTNYEKLDSAILIEQGGFMTNWTH